jgi:hypothetical protein
VLGNDRIPSGTAVTITITDEPRHGDVVVKADGTITNTATGTGDSDQFTYRVCDKDGSCSSAVVSVDLPDGRTSGSADEDAAGPSSQTPTNPRETPASFHGRRSSASYSGGRRDRHARPGGRSRAGRSTARMRRMRPSGSRALAFRPRLTPDEMILCFAQASCSASVPAPTRDCLLGPAGLLVSHEPLRPRREAAAAHPIQWNVGCGCMRKSWCEMFHA